MCVHAPCPSAWRQDSCCIPRQLPNPGTLRSLCLKRPNSSPRKPAHTSLEQIRESLICLAARNMKQQFLGNVKICRIPPWACRRHFLSTHQLPPRLHNFHSHLRWLQVEASSSWGTVVLPWRQHCVSSQEYLNVRWFYHKSIRQRWTADNGWCLRTLLLDSTEGFSGTRA